METSGTQLLEVICLPGDTIFNGIGIFSVTNSCLATKGHEMKERDAPVSKRTSAGISLTERLPIITSVDSSA